ncbi:MAG: hypothetical protein LBD93_06760 [Treponema sp.]|jgi:hypothetical protein|nr:hypothetical protein [Treponema sp.]
MKKTLLKIFLTLLAGVGIVLTSCEQPQFSSEVYPTTSLEKPVVSAQSWNGAVVLSWTPVANAGSYKVVRKDNETNLTSDVSPLGTLHAVDKMGFSSTLKDGGSYTYTVEAVSADASDKTLLVNSVSNPVTVSATIPARSPTIVAAPSADAVTVGPYVDEASTPDTEYLEVYWNVGSDLENKKEELLYSYKVEYSYGDGQVLPFSYDNEDLPNLGPYSKHVKFPLVGGESTVKITASWDSDNYYAPASVSIPYTGAPTLLPAVSSLNVDSTPADGSLTLTWSAVTGATGYDVYKAEITSGGPSGNSFINNISQLNGATIGEYETVSADSYQNGTTVYVTDSGYDSSKKWLYIVIAKNESARSSKPALYVRDKTDSSINVSFSISPVKDIDGNWVVSVFWTKKEGVSYKLSRAPVEVDSSSPSMVTKVGTYVEIAQDNLTDNGKEVIYLDQDLPVAQSYRYLLVGTKDGNTKKVTQDLTASPFTKVINVPFLTAVISHPTKLYHFRITPVKPLNYEDLTYEIYAASVYQGGVTSGWVLVQGNITSTDPFDWPAPDTRLGYVFSQVTKSGTTTLVNQTNSGITGPVYPKTTSLSGFTFNVGGENATTAVIQISGTFDSGYATNPTYQSLNGLKLYRGVEKGSSTFDNSAPVATVQFNSSASATTVAGVSIPAYTFYISLPKHHTLTADGSETWYLGTENNHGNITGVAYYSITKSGTSITVSSFYNY